MNEFREWMTAMGFNGKQMAKAGELIGMGASTAQLCYRGERRVSATERLAMSATLAGLPGWSIKQHLEIMAGGKVLKRVASYVIQDSFDE